MEHEWPERDEQDGHSYDTDRGYHEDDENIDDGGGQETRWRGLYRKNSMELKMDKSTECLTLDNERRNAIEQKFWKCDREQREQSSRFEFVRLVPNDDELTKTETTSCLA